MPDAPREVSDTMGTMTVPAGKMCPAAGEGDQEAGTPLPSPQIPFVRFTLGHLPMEVGG